MKINISIEARMTSSRLPGKVLKPINGIPAIELMYQRIKDSKYINDIIIATTTNDTDNPLVQWCEKNNVSYFRGSEKNVYERVLGAHQKFGTDIIVQLTGDCPLISSEIIELVVEEYLNRDYDYVVKSREFPIGLGIAVFSKKILESVQNERELTYEDKEHVTPYLYTSGKYTIFRIPAKEKYIMPELSITLDTKEDFEVIENICKHFDTILFSVEDIINYAKVNPSLMKINETIQRKGLK